MHNSKAKIWFLLAYLVLMLNLGQSVHRIGHLGHHAQLTETAQISSSSCCCHHHTSPVQGTETDGEIAYLFGDGDCAFCKFFDQYNVTVIAPDTVCFSEYSCLVFLADELEGSPSSISFTARGPPTA